MPEGALLENQKATLSTHPDINLEEEHKEGKGNEDKGLNLVFDPYLIRIKPTKELTSHHI